MFPTIGATMTQITTSGLVSKRASRGELDARQNGTTLVTTIFSLVLTSNSSGEKASSRRKLSSMDVVIRTLELAYQQFVHADVKELRRTPWDKDTLCPMIAVAFVCYHIFLTSFRLFACLLVLTSGGWRSINTRKKLLTELTKQTGCRKPCQYRKYRLIGDHQV